MTMRIVRPEFRCGDCTAGTALYLCPRDDGHNIQIVYACEHLTRLWYPDAPAELRPAEQS